VEQAKPHKKEIKKDLAKYHFALNHPEVLPEQWIRINHSNHVIVCWVNSLICLFNSGNYEPLPIFIGRVYKRLNENNLKTIGEPYRNLVNLYCAQLSYFIMNYTSIEGEEITNYLPQNILFAGPTYFPLGQYPERAIEHEAKSI
jgi:hypothetical protein